MLNDNQLETEVRDLLMDICEVMSRRGYEMVSVGAMMRLVGVGDDRAAAHDQEYFALDDFQRMLAQRNKKGTTKNNNNKKVQRHNSDGVTLH